MSPGPSEALRLLTAAADAASRALADARAGHGRAELAAEVGIGGDGAPTRGSPHPIVRGRPGLRGRAGPAGRSGLADDRANRLAGAAVSLLRPQRANGHAWWALAC